MNICKRITTLLLTVCMLLSILPLGSAPVATATTLPTIDPITPEVAAEDAIRTCYFTFSATSEVNGHDYLYLCLKGGKLLVYDVDDKKLLDSETIASTPRSIYVDNEGIVWICGSYGLFRYDPYTGNAEDIPLAKNFFDSSVSTTAGVTGDGNGKIYFGTANHGYLGCYDTATKTYTRISDWLPDSKWAGYAGLVYKDGYLYLGIDGDMDNDGTTTHAVIKYDIANQKIVDQLDVSDRIAGKQYLYCLNLVGDVLFGSIFGRLDDSVYIDISGNEMKFIEIENLPIGHSSEVSEVVDGNVYFMGYFGNSQTRSYIKYNIATKTATQIKKATHNHALRLTCGSMVTVEEFPGQSVIMIPVNDETNHCIDLYFLNPTDGTELFRYSITSISDGTGNSLRAPVLDPTGKYIYMGAFGNNSISKYSIEEGKVVDTFPTYSHQTDSLFFYNDQLYAGTYSSGSITKIDTVNRTGTPLFSLRYTVFEQCRMWATTGGGNKVFAGTTPYSGYGGVLVWHDLSSDLTYVAGGPNPEDVYYADTSNTDETTYIWYNAVTGAKADFDDDNDGTDDVYVNGIRRFKGPIPNQVINNLIYKDGYLYGTTSAFGSSGNSADDASNAQLFVYDVAAMKVIATCDLADHFTFLTDLIPVIDQLAEDPNVPGKFWGVVSDTLFTMTFDLNTKTFSIKEELSLRKIQYYSKPGSAYAHRDIVFDGPYMYVSFSRNAVGTYMIVKDAPTVNCRISTYSPNEAVLASDGNLYWTTNQTVNGDDTATNNLLMFRTAGFSSGANIAKITSSGGAVSYAYTNDHVATALAVKGNTVTLLKDVEVSEATMAEGVVLDLNGCTITGNVATMQGTVTDTSNGGGLIAEKPATTAPGQVALKDGNDGYRVVNYSVVLDPTSVIIGSDVHFWYRITFDGTNVDAYALAKEDSDFTLGVNVTVNGSTAEAEFAEGLEDEWATAMAADTGTTGLHLCILNGAKLSMSLSPTVNGVEHTSAIEHTAVVEGYPFTLNIAGLSNPLYGTVILTAHTFSE